MGRPVFAPTGPIRHILSVLLRKIRSIASSVSHFLHGLLSRQKPIAARRIANLGQATHMLINRLSNISGSENAPLPALVFTRTEAMRCPSGMVSFWPDLQDPEKVYVGIAGNLDAIEHTAAEPKAIMEACKKLLKGSTGYGFEHISDKNMIEIMSIHRDPKTLKEMHQLSAQFDMINAFGENQETSCKAMDQLLALQERVASADVKALYTFQAALMQWASIHIENGTVQANDSLQIIFDSVTQALQEKAGMVIQSPSFPLRDPLPQGEDLSLE